MKNIEDINPQNVAENFVSILNGWLTKAEMNQIRRLNKIEEDKGICHSHDFCDPNVAMLEAVELEAEGDVDVSSQNVIELMNSAWDIAKKANFDFKPKSTKS